MATLRAKLHGLLRPYRPVSQEFVFVRVLERAQAEQGGVKAEFADQRGFANGLPGLSADTGDSNSPGNRRKEDVVALEPAYVPETHPQPLRRKGVSLPRPA